MNKDVIPSTKKYEAFLKDLTPIIEAKRKDEIKKIEAWKREYEIFVITKLCRIRDDGKTVDFTPWLEMLKPYYEKEPENYELFFNEHTTLTLSQKYIGRYLDDYPLHVVLTIMSNQEYSAFRWDFLGFLHKLYDDCAFHDKCIEEDNPGMEPFYLPKREDIAEIHRAFEPCAEYTPSGCMSWHMGTTFDIRGMKKKSRYKEESKKTT